MRPWETYWMRVYERAGRLDADGCSWASEMFYPACLEHDIHYRTHVDLDGQWISKSEADVRFRYAMQELSWFGVLSPLSWIRYCGVRLFGERSWEKGGVS